MTEREMLKFAAKAIGYPVSEGYFEDAHQPGAWWGWVYINSSGDPPNDSAWTELWNPLTDDGDALRLAVKLNMTCRFYFGNSVAQATVPGGPSVHEDENSPSDPTAGARLAIVRAAAKIGKAMP